MAKNFIQNGETIDFVAKQNVKSGDVVILNDLVAIAVTDVKATEIGTGLVDGVWRVKVTQADDVKQGDTLYWKESDNEATKTKGSNKVLGKAWSNSGTSSTEVDVKINV